MPPFPARVIRRVPAALLLLAATAASCHAANPLAVIGETFSDWKDRLFGRHGPDVVEAPAEGPVALQPGHPQKLHVGEAAPTRMFPAGSSRYRVVELPATLAHAAVRVQVVAQSNPHGRGHVVFKPYLYVLDAAGEPRAPVEVKPLHLDIRPFRRTRLLGCVPLEDVRRFAVATSPAVVGKSYQSEVRDAVKAPTRGGFYYATDAVKVKLPYADTGVLVLEVTAADAAGKGC